MSSVDDFANYRNSIFCNPTLVNQQTLHTVSLKLSQTTLHILLILISNVISYFNFIFLISNVFFNVNMYTINSSFMKELGALCQKEIQFVQIHLLFDNKVYNLSTYPSIVIYLTEL